MQELNSTTVKKTDLPIKFLQFGEGNFLRAFVEWMIQKANTELHQNFGGVIVQPLPKGMVSKLKEQDNLYHVILEGIKDGVPVREIQQIDCIVDAVNPYSETALYEAYALNADLEFVFSNTTEAGITKVKGEDILHGVPSSFPGKVLALLYKRFEKFAGDPSKGLHFICCELIEDNATTLKRILDELAAEYHLSSEFITWVNACCTFNNSLVDRIVTGFPKDSIDDIKAELDYNDNMVVTAEYYHQWAIEAPELVQHKLPLDKAGLNIVWTKDMKAYRDKKVRILNGAHTALVPVGLLAGHQTVKEAFANATIEKFIRALISEEVIPNIKEDQAEVKAFANAILERFFNPYIKHYLKDISLNSLSKWVTRDLPSLKDDYQRTGQLPQRLTLSLAALLELYVGDNDFEANDTHPSLEELMINWKSDHTIQEKVSQTLSDITLWSEDLSQYKGLVDAVTQYIENIRKYGIISVIEKIA